jgi:hypothetical protein
VKADKARATRLKELRELKKERVLTEKRKKISTNILLLVASFITIIIFTGIYLATAKAPSKIKRVKVSAGVNYTLKDIKMTSIEAKVEDGYVKIPLAKVKKHSLVAFWYGKKKIRDARGREKPLPLLAMISPSGRLITAVSVCEPCRSEWFHTEPDGTLTCNVCNTKWDLETFQGISGGCPNYPPEELPHEIRDGWILIREEILLRWKPRVV